MNADVSRLSKLCSGLQKQVSEIKTTKSFEKVVSSTSTPSMVIQILTTMFKNHHSHQPSYKMYWRNSTCADMEMKQIWKMKIKITISLTYSMKVTPKHNVKVLTVLHRWLTKHTIYLTVYRPVTLHASLHTRSS